MKLSVMLSFYNNLKYLNDGRGLERVDVFHDRILSFPLSLIDLMLEQANLYPIIIK